MGTEKVAAWAQDDPGIGWGLRLTAQRRRRMSGGLPFRLAAPFMALGGRWVQTAGIVSLPAALPWLTLRWLEWPERDGNTGRTDAPVSRTVAVPAFQTGSTVAGAVTGARLPQGRQPQSLLYSTSIIPTAGNLSAPALRTTPDPVGAGDRQLPGQQPVVFTSVFQTGSTVTGTVAGARLPQGKQLQSLLYSSRVIAPEGNLSAPDPRTTPGSGGAGDRQPTGQPPTVFAPVFQTGSTVTGTLTGAQLAQGRQLQSLLYSTRVIPVAGKLAAPDPGTTPGPGGADDRQSSGQPPAVFAPAIQTGSTVTGAVAGARLPQGRQLQRLLYSTSIIQPVSNLSAPSPGKTPGPVGAGDWQLPGQPPAIIAPVFQTGSIISWAMTGAHLPRGRQLQSLLYGIRVIPPVGKLSAPDPGTTPGPGGAGSGTVAGRGAGMSFPQEVHDFGDTPGDAPGNMLRGAVAPGPVLLQRPALLMELIGRAVEREVTEAIRKQSEESCAQAPEPADRTGMRAQEVPVSDKQVRLYMRQMRKLAEEERFRLGLLR